MGDSDDRDPPISRWSANARPGCSGLASSSALPAASSELMGVTT